jgi:hypothetical protein
VKAHAKIRCPVDQTQVSRRLAPVLSSAAMGVAHVPAVIEEWAKAAAGPIAILR